MNVSGAAVADVAMTSVVNSSSVDATADSLSTPGSVALFQRYGFRIVSFKVGCYTH